MWHLMLEPGRICCGSEVYESVTKSICVCFGCRELHGIVYIRHQVRQVTCPACRLILFSLSLERKLDHQLQEQLDIIYRVDSIDGSERA